MLNALAAVMERPGTLAEGTPAGLARAGMTGYAAGALGFFAYMRVFSAVPPGALSFLIVLTLLVSSDFVFSAVTHLFMEVTGVKGGSASRLFLAFGCTSYIFGLLVPLALLARLGNGGAFLAFMLCLGGVLYARAAMVRSIYPVSANKSALAVWLPYAAFISLSFLAFAYFMAWCLWLMIW